MARSIFFFTRSSLGEIANRLKSDAFSLNGEGEKYLTIQSRGAGSENSEYWLRIGELPKDVYIFDEDDESYSVVRDDKK